MKFNVLERSLNINQNYLLEASAGTGKTFSIEHLVVRFLLEDRPLSTLLVVTFTRAATRDLKLRIRGNIQKALQDLDGQHTSFDYLYAIIEQGDKAVAEAKRRLENALFNFDQAHITTIHSFCLRMLTDFGFTANLSVEMPESENSFPRSEILQLVHDYFRTDLSQFKPSQVELMQKYYISFENLEAFLINFILEGKEIEEQPDYQELFSRFQRAMSRLKKYGFVYLEEIPHFKELLDRSGKLKEKWTNLNGFQKLLDQDGWTEEDFDWLIADQLSILKAFDQKNLKSKGEDRKRDFFQAVKRELDPLINVRVFLAKMVSDCHKKVKHHLKQVEKYRFDDLLRLMKEAILHPTFAEAVRSQYQIAIIDEFQDTDPLQWSIFRDLFLREDKLLYLVGDPKQSIYAFRQADIYTYLEAALAMGACHNATLDTNYRSQPSLINALNALFSKSDFLKLPRLGTFLKYRPVVASPKASVHLFKDEKGALHFSLMKESQDKSIEQLDNDYFPFIVQEIQHLIKSEKMQYEQIAILVADRYQAERLSRFLDQWKIPTVNQKQTSLVDSIAYSAIRELMQAVLNPKDLRLIKQVLGGKIFGWTHLEILSLDPIQALEWFSEFHKMLQNEGFGYFFQKVMEFRLDEKTVAERILSREEGESLYDDLFQIVEILIVSHASSDELIETLDEFRKWDFNQDERIKKRYKSCKAVNIMTIHSSKGLEFDVVFVLGLLKRSKIPDPFYPCIVGNQTVYKPIIDEECQEFQNYCKEIDAEKMRQLYVAMTRARYRVYVPLASKGDKGVSGTFSPLEIFFSFPVEELKSVQEITWSQLNRDTTLDVLQDLPIEISIQKPPIIHIQNEPVKIGSFTALAKKVELNNEKIFPSHFTTEEKNPHTLPVGSETGNLLHKLLETLPLVLPPEHYLSFVQPYIERTPYHEWGEVICKMLYQALHVPFIAGDSLRNVHPAEIERETEFLFKNNQGYIKGFVDLMCRHRGKYYLIDWKTNWLGADQDCYNRENMESCMKESDYFLQASIYTQAFKKTLALSEPRSFDEVFGGVIYVFLRGLTKQTGIFHFWPDL